VKFNISETEYHENIKPMLLWIRLIKTLIYRIITIFKNHSLGMNSNVSETVYHRNIKHVPLDKTYRKLKCLITFCYIQNEIFFMYLAYFEKNYKMNRFCKICNSKINYHGKLFQKRKLKCNSTILEDAPHRNTIDRQM